MSLTPELQRLAAKLDKQFAAEDREIIREAKREREAEQARRALGLPVKQRKRAFRAYEGFASGGTYPQG
ncbi:MAG: hypothetical protein GX440_02495 [Propionibacterium sp.]|jgi:hypothetical protein|nr:hypothetical protein [Propionibacterium sp.]